MDKIEYYRLLLSPPALHMCNWKNSADLLVNVLQVVGESCQDECGRNRETTKFAGLLLSPFPSTPTLHTRTHEPDGTHACVL